MKSTKEPSRPKADRTKTRMNNGGMKNRTSQKILDYLDQEPGACVSDVATHFGFTPQNASRHLTRLLKLGKVHCELEGRERYYFLSEHTSLHVRMRPHFLDPRRRRIADFLIANPGTTWNINQLAEQTKLTFNTVQRTIETLESKGLVKIQRDESRWRIKTTAKLPKVLHEHDEAEKTRHGDTPGDPTTGTQPPKKAVQEDEMTPLDNP